MKKLDNVSLLVFILSSILGVLGWGNVDIRHYSQEGEVSVFQSDLIVESSFGWVPVLKLGSTCLGLLGFAILTKYYSDQLVEEEPQAETIEQQVMREANVKRLLQAEELKTELYGQDLPLKLLAEKFNKEKGVPYQLALELASEVLAETQQEQKVQKQQHKQELNSQETINQLLSIIQSKSSPQAEQDTPVNNSVTLEAPPVNNSTQDTPVNNSVTLEAPPVNSQDLRIYLGRDSNNQRVHIDFGSMINGFILGFGMSGSGKTETIKVFLQELQTQGYPCLFLAYHKDLKSFPGYKTFKISSLKSDLVLNPFSIISFDPNEGGPKQARDLASSIISDVENLGVQQKSLLSKALAYLFRIQGFKDLNPETWGKTPPNPQQLIQLLREIIEEFELSKADKEYHPNLPFNCSESSVRTLEGVLYGLFDSDLFKGKETPLDEVFTGSNLIDLSSLPHSKLKWLFTNHLLTRLNSWLEQQKPIPQGARGKDRFRLFLGIDEGKIAVAPTPESVRRFKESPTHPLNKIATEIRKYGLGSFIFSQAADHYSEDILREFGTIISMLTAPKERKKISDLVNIPLGVLEGLIKSGEAIYKNQGGVNRLMISPSNHSDLTTDRGQQ